MTLMATGPFADAPRDSTVDGLEPDDLYDERGDVSWSRPIFQGDVFDRIPLADFDDKPHLVQVLTHPCSMRRGAKLTERLQVAPVLTCRPEKDWSKRFKVMPLPNLRESEDCYCADFTESTSVRTSRLQLGLRVATLSHSGIYVLQRRLVYYMTRVRVPREDFIKQARPNIHELELQTEWMDNYLGDREPTVELVNEGEQAFHRWLDDTGRERLDDEAQHAQMRRDLREHWARD